VRRRDHCKKAGGQAGRVNPIVAVDGKGGDHAVLASVELSGEGERDPPVLLLIEGVGDEPPEEPIVDGELSHRPSRDSMMVHLLHS
jgi:hypothetical protein